MELRHDGVIKTLAEEYRIKWVGDKVGKGYRNEQHRCWKCSDVKKNDEKREKQVKRGELGVEEWLH